MADITKAQALALADAMERDERAAPRPCPDMLQAIGEWRDNPSLLIAESRLWEVDEYQEWITGTLFEHIADAGAILVVAHGEGERGILVLADGTFHPVNGNPSEDWDFTLGDDHSGFATFDEAKAAALNA